MSVSDVRMSLSYPTAAHKSFAGIAPCRWNARVGKRRAYELLLCQCGAFMDDGLRCGDATGRVAAMCFFQRKPRV
jgi:hypothetical protein